MPSCYKTSAIIPVPKKKTRHQYGLSDYWPVALTSIIMKCFEILVKDHISSALPSSPDPFQFAYSPNRSTGDGTFTTLDFSLEHLENKNSLVRMLLVDFSSAFKTIIPQHLVNKLGSDALGISSPLCITGYCIFSQTGLSLCG